MELKKFGIQEGVLWEITNDIATEDVRCCFLTMFNEENLSISGDKLHAKCSASVHDFFLVA